MVEVDVKMEAKAEEKDTPQLEVKSEENVKGNDVPKVEIKTEGDKALNQKIVKQIEYYFGDVNLSRDKFLQEQIKLDDGWVPMETMLKFNRLKILSEDANIITAAIRNSESGLMEVSEDGLKIRRAPARPMLSLTKDLAEDLKKRTVYAKTFPAESALDDLIEFFEKFGPTDHVQMRRDNQKKFKGSCFVTYHTKEAALNFLEKTDINFSTEELTRLFKEDYFKKKNDDRKNKSEEAKKEKEKEEREKLKEKITQGAILVVGSIPKETKRDGLKNFLLKYGKVEWVDLDENMWTAKVRFSKEDEAKSVLEKAKAENDGKVIWDGTELQCSVLEGDDELEHWSDVYKAKAAKSSGRNDYNRNKGSRGSGRQRGGHHGGHSKRRRDDNDDGPEEKKVKGEKAEVKEENDDDIGDAGDSDDE